MDTRRLFELCPQPVALVIGHPGHELRIHHWVETLRPCVFVLTDGSGRSGISRIESTRSLLNTIGAQAGPLFGKFTDQQLYAALIERNMALFVDIAMDLAFDFATRGVQCVIGDAYEGYNPTHDACRLVIGAATVIAERQTNVSMTSFAFPLAADPQESSSRRNQTQGQFRLALTDDAFDRKLAAARNYSELAAEFAAAMEKFGLNAFRTECLWPVDAQDGYDGPLEAPPFYERYGERQVASGHYQSVIRYDPHVRELALALHAATEGGC